MGHQEALSMQSVRWCSCRQASAPMWPRLIQCTDAVAQQLLLAPKQGCLKVPHHARPERSFAAITPAGSTPCASSVWHWMSPSKRSSVALPANPIQSLPISSNPIQPPPALSSIALPGFSTNAMDADIWPRPGSPPMCSRRSGIADRFQDAVHSGSSRGFNPVQVTPVAWILMITSL